MKRITIVATAEDQAPLVAAVEAAGATEVSATSEDIAPPEPQPEPQPEPTPEPEPFDINTVELNHPTIEQWDASTPGGFVARVDPSLIGLPCSVSVRLDYPNAVGQHELHPVGADGCARGNRSTFESGPCHVSTQIEHEGDTRRSGGDPLVMES